MRREGGASSNPTRRSEIEMPQRIGSSAWACHRARVRATRWRMMTA